MNDPNGDGSRGDRNMTDGIEEPSRLPEGDAMDDAISLDQVKGSLRARPDETRSDSGDAPGEAPGLDANAGTGGSGHDPGLTGDAIPMEADARVERREPQA